jgi:hypothetical protein
MNTIGENTLWSFYKPQDEAEEITTPTIVRRAKGHHVTSFMDLATKIAELQFRNPDFVLMFRGQNGDHRNSKGNTTIKPSLFRSPRGSSDLPSMTTLQQRYEKLESAEQLLVTQYRQAGLLGKERLQRHRMLRWAILQHYEVCDTPLLDVTHSLRIAASFASMDAQTEAFVYVLGVPNLSGAITASAEGGLQIIRLASVCPPSALRPHIQEGYLLGEYPDMVDYDQKELYGHYEIDFGRRLIAKFRFSPVDFWQQDVFPQVPREALYPPFGNDPLRRIAKRVKAEIAQT